MAGSDLQVHPVPRMRMRRWLAALEEEFFMQGDREAAAGLPISPLFDRTKQGASKSQVRCGPALRWPVWLPAPVGLRLRLHAGPPGPVLSCAGLFSLPVRHGMALRAGARHMHLSACLVR